VPALTALLMALVVVPAASAAPTPFTDIHSAGPLSDIYIGNDLSCQVRSGGFSSTEFFPNAAGPGDCGTFLFINTDGPPEFLGPDFLKHAGGTHTTGNFADTEVPFTPVSQSISGSGTSASPYRVTTVATGVDDTLTLTFTEVDTYIVGSNLFQTNVTVSDTSADTGFNGELYHAADCELRGNDNGFGEDPPPNSPNTATCTPNVLGNPPSALEQFMPITTTTGQSWEQRQIGTPGVGGLWADLNDQALLNECDSCRGTVADTGIAIEWPIALAAGESQTFSFNTVVVDTVPTAGLSFTGPAGSTVGGTVATITDPNTSATASTYSATINWGDGSSSAGTITGGNGTFNVAGSHSYAAAGTYPLAVTITSVGTSQGSSTVSDTATITAAPSPVVTGTPTVSPTGAGFTGSVNPDGLATTASFQYGLDPKYSGGGPIVYTQSTPAQTVGSDFSSHAVTASVSGLVANAVYHVRLAATNSAGTTFGPDVTFTTSHGATPGSPTLGKTFNLAPVSGTILVKINGVFVPLTELTQIPKNTVIDALHGALSLTTATTGGSHPAHDAAKGKKPKPKPKTQKGTFGGAVFKLSQATRGAGKGLVTLTLVEGAGFKGAPTYATCKKPKKKAGDASAAAASSKALQLLHASAKGKFKTSGRYAAATVRGTKWTITDRCDGTLTHDVTDSVAVTDFVHHKTIILHAGQTYLAKKP
jgi:hypothetical protein